MNTASSNRMAAKILGQALTLDSLPSASKERWVARTKALIVAAIRSGLISRRGVCERYSLSNDELISWEQLLDLHGLPGLRATRVQLYRRSQPE